MKFEDVAFHKTIGDCEDDICVNIEIEYLKMEGDSETAQNFNHLIEQFIFRKMSISDDIKELTPEEYVAGIVKEFKSFKTEFPDANTGGYEQTTNCKLTWSDEKLISVELLTSVYSGGAHPSYLDEFLNVDPKTGNAIDILGFITDKETFKAFVESKLRLKLGMGENDKWEDFTFVDKFILPENMGMTEKGLRLVYNEYEILPYSDGKTEILITNDELKDFSSF
ncbi:MAG: DUF3298 and DUF4163 domain-containing protein [Chlorobi bacterium]|nr:DUF3298 and DUF4163 domain-containing protein [Chlorobiota bacterium]